MTLKINGQIIPDAAIEYELNRLVQFYSEHMSEAEIREQLDALRARAREQAIGAKLLLDDAARLDIRVPEEDLAEKFNEIVTRCGGRDAFDAMLTKEGVTEETVRAGVEQGRRVDLLVERITAGLSDPTEEEIRRHFEQHKADYAVPQRASAQHILVKFDPANSGDRASAEAKIEKIRRDIEGGANFADQAAMHSDCPSGKQSGGSLGWFSRGMMVPAFDNAVFAMAVDDLGEVVETQFGFHLIHKTGEQEGGPADYDDVREKVRDFLRHVARGEAISGYVAELREKAVIEDD